MVSHQARAEFNQLLVFFFHGLGGTGSMAFPALLLSCREGL